MKIAVAQIKPFKGDIYQNLEIHKDFIAIAVSYKAAAIFFPELSATSYEPVLADLLAIQPEDDRFNEIQALSDLYTLIIGLGVPTRHSAGIRISMLIFRPGKPREVYSKQQLHEDEMPYFVNGHKQILISLNDIQLAPAICYESLQPSHADQAYNFGADIYIASVAKSQNGITKAMAHYPQMAVKYAMPVLMANCTGYCDNFEGAGQSAVWTSDGNLAAVMDKEAQGLLVFDTETEEVVEFNI